MPFEQDISDFLTHHHFIIHTLKKGLKTIAHLPHASMDRTTVSISGDETSFMLDGNEISISTERHVKVMQSDLKETHDNCLTKRVNWNLK